MATNIHEEIEDEREAFFPEADELKTVRRYVAGQAGVKLTVDQKRALGNARPMNDNILKAVVTAHASRLELLGFEAKTAALKRFLDFDLYTKCGLAALSHDANVAKLRDGNHCVGVRWLPDRTAGGVGRIALFREKWWDGEAGVFVSYDGLEPRFAVKEYVDRPSRTADPVKRRVIYFPDHIERWREDGNGWKPYALPGDPASADRTGWVPWTKDAAGNDPLGIPLVHFRTPSPTDTPYGRSEVGDLLALQDDVNLIQTDISAAAAFTGFQMYWMAGVDTKSKFIVGPGRVHMSDDPNAKFGAFPAGDIGKLIEAHAHKRQTISFNSQTPIHVITGADWPAGIALLRAEMPLVVSVQRQGKLDGPKWSTVAHRATEIANVFGPGGLDEDDPITTVFAPAEKLDDQAVLEIQRAKVDLYTALSAIDDEVLLEKTGLLTKAEITALLTAKQARRDQMAALAPQF